MDGVTSLPDSVRAPALERWFPRFVVVVEGAANAGFDDDGAEGQIAEGQVAEGQVADGQVRSSALRAEETTRSSARPLTSSRPAEVAGRCLVVTADRELRARCEAVGAAVTGPRWLLDLL